MKLLKRLNEPYPSEFTWRCALKYGILTGVFVWLFFLLFEPFDLNKLPGYAKTYLYPGYGIICLLSIILTDAIIPGLIPRPFREKGWKLYKNILWAMWTTFVIGVGAFYLTRIVFLHFNFSTSGLRFFHILPATFFVGVFPISFITLSKLNTLLAQSRAIASEANPRINIHRSRQTEAPPQKKEVELVADNKRDRFRTSLGDLLYIAAEDNYVEVFYFNEKVKKLLLRSSLSRIQDQLRPFYPTLFRCHRTYLVNMDKILNVSGNAQGLKLSMERIDCPVPVARRYVNEFRKIIQEFN